MQLLIIHGHHPPWVLVLFLISNNPRIKAGLAVQNVRMKTVFGFIADLIDTTHR